MKFDRLTSILSIIVILLLIPTGMIVINDIKEAKLRTENVYVPEIIFKENIRFSINVGEFEPLDHLDKIINTEETEYDEVKELQFKVNEIGEKTGIISLVQQGRVGEKSFKYEVYDDKNPIIHEKEELVTYVGEELEYEDYFRISDNSLKEDETLPLNIEGTVNFDVVGIYYISVSVEDEAGNSASISTSVRVIPNEVIEEPTPESDYTPGGGSGTQTGGTQTGGTGSSTGGTGGLSGGSSGGTGGSSGGSSAGAGGSSGGSSGGTGGSSGGSSGGTGGSSGGSDGGTDGSTGGSDSGTGGSGNGEDGSGGPSSGNDH